MENETKRRACQLIIYLGYDEAGQEVLATIKALARLAGLPVSRYIRQKLGLEPIAKKGL